MATAAKSNSTSYSIRRSDTRSRSRLACPRLESMGTGKSAQRIIFALPYLRRVRAIGIGRRVFSRAPARQLLEVDEEGIPQVDPLNAEFDDAYLQDKNNPRWIAKPTCGLPLGADRNLQTVPGYAAAAQDTMVVQEVPKARAANNGTECRPDWRSLQCAELTYRKTAATRHSDENTTSALGLVPCLVPAQPAPAAARS